MTEKLIGDYLPITFEYKDWRTGDKSICSFFIPKQWIESGTFSPKEGYIGDMTPENMFGVNLKAVLAAIEVK